MTQSDLKKGDFVRIKTKKFSSFGVIGVVTEVRANGWIWVGNDLYKRNELEKV